MDYCRRDAKTLIKASLERMPEIDAYADDGQRIVGKQEARVMQGNGVVLNVDVPTMQERDDRTTVDVTAEKVVAIDQSADPASLKADFIARLNDLRGRTVSDVLAEMSQYLGPEDSKEVDSVQAFGTAGGAIGIRFVVLFALSILFTVFMMAVMMP